MNLTVVTSPISASNGNFTIEVSILLPDPWQIWKALAEKKTQPVDFDFPLTTVLRFFS